MNVTHEENLPCVDVNNVEKDLPPIDQSKDFVADRVLRRGRQSKGGKLAKSPLSVDNAGEFGRTTSETIENSVVESVRDLRVEQIAQVARSAVNLCDLCGTSIARSIVLISQGHDPELNLLADCITEQRKQILYHSLVLTAARSGNIDITMTTQSQRMLFGFVSSVMENFMANDVLDHPPSRFHDFVEDQISNTDPVKYMAKASRAEREAGLDREAVIVNDGRKTSIDNAYQRGDTKRQNTHPTVKPISLNRWLATLLLPPIAYSPRRLFVPFAGVASEMIGAMQAGWECIIGVEGEQEYIDIGKERLKYWSSKEVKDTQLELVL